MDVDGPLPVFRKDRPLSWDRYRLNPLSGPCVFQKRPRLVLLRTAPLRLTCANAGVVIIIVVSATNAPTRIFARTLLSFILPFLSCVIYVLALTLSQVWERVRAWGLYQNPMLYRYGL